MNVLIIQEASRHPENFHFREALNLQRAFARIGVICNVWGAGYPDFSPESFQEQVKVCDVILLLENYGTTWLPDLSQISKPKIFWSIDAHWNLESQLITVDRHNINHVLSSTHSYCTAFARPGIRYCSWFPNAYPSDLISPHPEIPKTVIVGFCGNVVNRGDWIRLLENNVGMKFDNMVLGQDMVQTVCSYKIHWNRNVKDDINCRTWETLGCGTFLLTNATDRLSDLFHINEHLVTYASPKDCIDKIEFYLKNEKEREEIARAGHEHVKLWHTYDCRAKQFIDIVENRL